MTPEQTARKIVADAWYAAPNVQMGGTLLAQMIAVALKEERRAALEESIEIIEGCTPDYTPSQIADLIRALIEKEGE